MVIINQVILIGRLATDIDLRFIPGSGTAVANFSLAVDKGLTREKKAEFESQGKPVADFIRIVVWGKQAENCSQYLAKGRMVAVQGSIETSTDKSPTGETRYFTQVRASHVEFLEWGDKKNESSKSDDFSFGNADDFSNAEDTDDPPF